MDSTTKLLIAAAAAVGAYLLWTQRDKAKAVVAPAPVPVANDPNAEGAVAATVDTIRKMPLLPIKGAGKPIGLAYKAKAIKAASATPIAKPATTPIGMGNGCTSDSTQREAARRGDLEQFNANFCGAGMGVPVPAKCAVGCTKTSPVPGPTTGELMMCCAKPGWSNSGGIPVTPDPNKEGALPTQADCAGADQEFRELAMRLAAVPAEEKREVQGMLALLLGGCAPGSGISIPPQAAVCCPESTPSTKAGERCCKKAGWPNSGM